MADGEIPESGSMADTTPPASPTNFLPYTRLPTFGPVLVAL